MDELLSKISSPADLRALAPEQLKQLAAEVRNYILSTITRVGGHLASNLGSVELTLALHRVYDSPTDRIVWDVGHQSYAHKIVTGRREALPSIRRKGGLSGFPKRSESAHDAFGTAHASTSISAALGMAAAAGPGRAIAVIGDGALSGGMAYEALNCAGIRSDLDLLVVLNDNAMSISPAVGAMRQYLARLLATKFYNRFKDQSGRLLPPPMRDLIARAEEHLKGMVLPGTLFEELGFDYIGPLDGHNLDVLVATLEDLRVAKGPKLLHVVTVKGKGYQAAEQDPIKLHGVSASQAPYKTRTPGEPPPRPSYSQIFGRWLCAAAARDKRIHGITPAMREGSGLVDFARLYPDRYHDAGIAEQHAMTFAAGLACAGQRPVLAIYSTFLQRAYDQLIHDVALQELAVLLAIDRAGLVGADGATHHGAFDLSFLRCVPNIIIMAPSDEAECWLMLNTALAHNGPTAVRYPRGAGPGTALPDDQRAVLSVGQGKIRRRGSRLAILAFGSMLQPALAAAKTINATVADLRFVKPLDERLVLDLAEHHEAILTVEENVVAGGAGSAVGELLVRARIRKPLAHMGLPDHFIDHGSTAELLEEAGLTAAAMVKRAQQLLAAGS